MQSRDLEVFTFLSFCYTGAHYILLVHFVNSTEDPSSSAGHQKDPGPSTAISATPASAKTSKKRKRGNPERDRDDGENSGGSFTQNTTSNGNGLFFAQKKMCY